MNTAMKKLLLADDSATIERMVRLNFEGDEIEIACARDGDQAIVLFEKEKPDIVLADIYMPGKNGYDVCEHIKNHSRLFHTPVLLLRGSFEPFSEEEYSRVRADGVLTKPLDPNQLVQWVHRLLSRAKPTSNSSVSFEPADDLLEGPISPEIEVSLQTKPDSPIECSPLDSNVEINSPKAPLSPPNDTQEENDFLEIELSGIPYSGGELEDVLLEIPQLELMVGSKETAEQPVSESIGISEEEAIIPPPEGPPSSYISELSKDLLGTPIAGESGGQVISQVEQPETVVTSPDSFPPAGAVTKLTDDDIDHIAQRVVTRLSDRVLREIAWEILPDMAELILKEEIKKRSDPSL